MNSFSDATTVKDKEEPEWKNREKQSNIFDSNVFPLLQKGRLALLAAAIE